MLTSVGYPKFISVAKIDNELLAYFLTMFIYFYFQYEPTGM